VQTPHKLARLAEDVEDSGAHASHRLHGRRDVGRVGELHANVRDRTTERSHGERHDIEDSSAHGASIELEQFGPHRRRIDPVVRWSGVLGLLTADEGPVLHAGHVARVRAAQETVGSKDGIERNERSGLDETAAMLGVLLVRSVAPLDA